MLLLFFSNPASLFAQEDTEDAAGIVFIEGSLKIDDDGVKGKSEDVKVNIDEDGIKIISDDN